MHSIASNFLLSNSTAQHRNSLSNTHGGGYFIYIEAFSVNSKIVLISISFLGFGGKLSGISQAVYYSMVRTKVEADRVSERRRLGLNTRDGTSHSLVLLTEEVGDCRMGCRSHTCIHTTCVSSIEIFNSVLLEVASSTCMGGR